MHWSILPNTRSWSTIRSSSPSSSASSTPPYSIMINGNFIILITIIVFIFISTPLSISLHLYAIKLTIILRINCLHIQLHHHSKSTDPTPLHSLSRKQCCFGRHVFKDGALKFQAGHDVRHIELVQLERVKHMHEHYKHFEHFWTPNILHRHLHPFVPTTSWYQCLKRISITPMPSDTEWRARP